MSFQPMTGTLSPTADTWLSALTNRLRTRPWALTLFDGLASVARPLEDLIAPYGWQLQVAVDGLPDVLPVPTGLGKTEVALAWAWRLLVDKKPEPLHLVVCLPMRSLVTQTVQRLKTYFDSINAKAAEMEIAVYQLMGGAIDDERWLVNDRHQSKRSMFSFECLNEVYRAQTGHDGVCRWQQRLVTDLEAGRFLSDIELATGLGRTSKHSSTEGCGRAR